MKTKLAIAITTSIILSGCAATGANLQANVYKAGQVNSAQLAKTVTILAVMPAKIEVDNTKQKQTMQVVGGVLGAVAGGLAGGYGRIGGLGTAGTSLAGAAIGAGAGSLVSDKVLVDGVSLAYVNDANQTLSSAQVGQTCEFIPGKAIMISTGPNETRIQPNHTCPAE